MVRTGSTPVRFVVTKTSCAMPSSGSSSRCATAFHLVQAPHHVPRVSPVSRNVVGAPHRLQMGSSDIGHEPNLLESAERVDPALRRRRQLAARDMTVLVVISTSSGLGSASAFRARARTSEPAKEARGIVRSDVGHTVSYRPLPDLAVRRSRARGLWVGVTEFEPPRSGTLPQLQGGALIAKPVGVAGNALHEPQEIASDGNGEWTDMPHLKVTPTEDG